MDWQTISLVIGLLWTFGTSVWALAVNHTKTNNAHSRINDMKDYIKDVEQRLEKRVVVIEGRLNK